MKRKSKNKQSLKQTISVLVFTVIILAFTYFNSNTKNETDEVSNNIVIDKIENSFDLNSIPQYNDTNPYVVINNNNPGFTEADYTTGKFERYSDLDYLGRCGVAYANICRETMPPDGDERGNISRVNPTGWKQAKYKDGYLYNRCHLIGWQLSDEDDNELNLITGTNYFNVSGMLPFENMVDNYLEVKENRNNHVLYRVTPIFEGDNLVVNGVQMEAYSIEDNGKGICFNVYIYNVQPGIIIDYATGESKEK